MDNKLNSDNNPKTNNPIQDNTSKDYNKFLCVKTLAIVQVGFLYFITKTIFSILLDSAFKKDGLFGQLFYTNQQRNDPNITFKDIPIWKLTIQIIIQILLIILGIWILRKIIKKIPFYFDGKYGYKHSRLRESITTVIGTLSLLIFLQDFKDKTIYLVSKYREHLKI
tara:strand:+ start:1483 stop:1983 length:501 start_codon:yes stop_codon:yes gene_type:complete